MEASQSQAQSAEAQAPEESGAIQQAAQTPETRKITLNGEEREVPLDEIKRHLGIDEYDTKYDKQLVQAYQKSLAADHRFNEVNLTKKQVEAQRKQIELFNEVLVKDPDALLEELLDAGKLDEIAFKRIQRRFEIEQMTPDQREAYEARLERDKEKSQREKYEERIQKYEHEQAVSAHIETESQAMIDALQRSSLPMDKQTLQLTATYMLAGYSAQEAVAVLENRLPSMVDLWLQNATPDQIKKALSKQAREKMQTYAVSQVSRKPNNNAPPPGTIPPRRPGDEQQDYKAIRKQRLEAAFSGMEL